MSKIIAAANPKGGVGKTTSVSAIGFFLAQTELSVLMIDLDPQCSLTDSLLIEKPENTIYDAFINPKIKGKDIIKNINENLDIIPASDKLESLDVMLSGKKENKQRLLKFLRNIKADYHYDVIILDCPPSMQITTVNGLMAADIVIVPIVPEVLSIKGAERIRNMIDQLQEEYYFPWSATIKILITKYNKSKNLNKEIENVLKVVYHDNVFSSIIRNNIKIAEAPNYRKSIFEYCPDCAGARDYTLLGKELLSMIL